MGSAPSPVGSRPLTARAVAGGCLLAAVVAATSYWGFRQSRPTSPPPAPLTPAEDDLGPTPPANPGYVGVRACAPCHAKRVDEFSRTRHAVAMVPASAAKMPAAFTDGRGTHTSHVPGVRFDMGCTGSECAVTTVRATLAGEQRVRSPISFVYGSGGVLDEVYFAWRGDRLYELPVTYLHPLQTWGTVPFGRHLAGDFSRTASYRCLECHNTWFAHVPGSGNRFVPDSFHTGIGCEKCHGPGRDHVAHHSTHSDSPATAIVHPGHLSRDRLIDVCAQCHSNANKPRGPALSYRPGEPLENHYRTATSEFPEEDHVANQTKYMKLSKCFQKTDSLTCVTCHNPHKPTDHVATHRSCAKCHQPDHCKQQPELPAEVRADCAGCHMPPRVWMTVNFHTAEDRFVPPIRRAEHRIGVYPEATNAVLLEHLRRKNPASPDAQRLARALTDHWLAEADRRAERKRYLAAIGAVREALRVESSSAAKEKLRAFTAVQGKLVDDLSEGLHLSATDRVQDATRIFEAVLADHPRNATARGRLGTMLARVGKMAEAKAHLREVVKCDPNDAYGEGMLGWLAYNEGRNAEAVAHYERAEEIEPFNAKNRVLWGHALARLGRTDEAIEKFRASLAANPAYPEAHRALARTLRQIGRDAEAADHERRGRPPE